MIDKQYNSFNINHLAIAVTYVVLGIAYIYASDLVLKMMVADIGILSEIQSVKGTAFVAASGMILFFVARKYRAIAQKFYDNSVQEKRLSSDKLKKSEEKYWTVFNYSPVPMWIYDVESLRFLLVNEAACNKYGYSRDEFYQKNINDIRPIEDVAKIRNAVKQAIKTKLKTWSEPYTHICKDGSILYVKIKSAEIFFEGKIARLVTATDITDKIRDEQLLIEANQRLKNASDIANLGYWSFDLKTLKIYWSDTLYNIFEQDKNSFDLTLENIQNLFHPDDRKQIALDFGGVSDNSEIKEFERRITCGQGQQKWILERINLVKNAKGEPIALEGTALDITEKKLAQQAIQKSNERFKMAAKAAHEAIVDWDRQNGEILWSSGFKELFGHEPSTEDKTQWIRNIHPDDKKRIKADLAQALSNKATRYYYDEFRFLKANGQIAHVEQRGVFVRDAKGQVIRVVGAMIDVTALKERMLKIEQQNEKLREIAWIQSHVVRAPLATLMGMTNLLKVHDEYDIDPVFVIDSILESANKLDDVIREIVRKTEAVENGIKNRVHVASQ